MSGPYFFALHSGHLTARADRIARKHEAWHVNYTEPNGQRRGWFACRNQGNPFDQATAAAVLAEINRAGGINALRYARDRVAEKGEES